MRSKSTRTQRGTKRTQSVIRSGGLLGRLRRHAKLAAVLTVFATVGFVVVSSTHAASSSNGAYTNVRDSKKCIDDKDGKTTPGTQIRVWPCNNAPAQKVTAKVNKKGTLTLQMMGGKGCIDVANGHKNTGDGTIVRLWKCNDAAAQEWLITRNGNIINPQSGKCLGTRGGDLKDGAQMGIYKCSSNTAQRWKFPSGTAVTQSNSAIKFNSNKKICLDGGTEAGPLQSADCTSNNKQQKWYVTKSSDGYRFMNGINCIGANGDDVESQPCENKKSQYWKWDKSKRLVSAASSKKCLDTAGKTLESDQAMILSACGNSTSQKFAVPSK